MNRDYNPNRRKYGSGLQWSWKPRKTKSTRARVGNRGDPAVNTRPSSETSTSKGRPVTTNTRPVVDRGNTAKGQARGE